MMSSWALPLDISFEEWTNTYKATEPSVLSYARSHLSNATEAMWYTLESFTRYLYLATAILRSLSLGTPVGACGCEAACNALVAQFGSSVYTHGNGPDFVVWDQKQQQVNSACRVTPTSSQEVALILQTVVNNSCRFAVKGGGHARNADDSVSVGGVTIDMVRMKSLDLSSDRKTVRLGSGHILYTLYQGLENYNLSTTGGRVADVGLGGYALGGGLSNASPKYGLAVDNVFEYEIVLANSTVRNVTQDTYPDLYFALRGGMNNFGVITHFTMRTFSQGQMFGGSRSFAIDQRDAVVEEAYKLTTDWSKDTNMSFSYGFAYQQASETFSFSFTEAYSEPILDPLPFQKLNSLPYTSSNLRIDWMSNFSLESAAGRPSGSRNLYATVSYSPSVELDRQIQDIAVEEISSVKSVSGFSPNVIFQPLHENAILASKDREGSALGLESDGPLTLVLLTAGWSSSVDDQRMYDFASRLITRAEEVTIEAGKNNRWKYINYAYMQQDPFLGYGEGNRDRLRKIRREVDPNGIFTSTGLCRGYFKLN